MLLYDNLTDYSFREIYKILFISWWFVKYFTSFKRFNPYNRLNFVLNEKPGNTKIISRNLEDIKDYIKYAFNQYF